MNIPAELEDQATSLWTVQTYLHHIPGPIRLFASLDAATQYVHHNIAQRVPFRATLKDAGSDDLESPDGSVDGLSWDCPMRVMTLEECRASTNPYAKDWIKSGNHPNTYDLDAARGQQIKFVAGEVTTIFVHRLSRHLGYIRRSGVLNDKTKDVKQLLKAWNELEGEDHARP